MFKSWSKPSQSPPSAERHGSMWGNNIPTIVKTLGSLSNITWPHKSKSTAIKKNIYIYTQKSLLHIHFEQPSSSGKQKENLTCTAIRNHVLA